MKLASHTYLNCFFLFLSFSLVRLHAQSGDQGMPYPIGWSNADHQTVIDVDNSIITQRDNSWAVSAMPRQKLHIKSAPHAGGRSTPIAYASLDANLLTAAAVRARNLTHVPGSVIAEAMLGTAPYGYARTTCEPAGSISSGKPGDYSRAVIDIEGPPHHKLLSLNYSVNWDVWNTVESNGILTRNTSSSTSAWGIGGGLSSNKLPSNTDGSLEFVATTTSTYIIGFAVKYSYNFGDFTHAVALDHQSNTLSIYEGAGNPMNSTFQSGDVIRISRVAGTVTYYRNDMEIRSVAAIPTDELRIKAMIHTANGSMPKVTASFDARLLLSAVVRGTDAADGTGSISLTPLGTPPFTYTWSSGESTSSITNKTRGSYTVTVSDAAGRSLVRTYSIGYKPFWKEFVNAFDVNGVITRIGIPAWNSTANSSTALEAHQNGSIEFTANPGSVYFIGFSNDPAGTTPSAFTHGIRPDITGTLWLYEAGFIVYTGVWERGDVLRVARENDRMKYFKNGMELRNIAVDPNIRLFAKTVVSTGSSSLVNTSFHAIGQNIYDVAWTNLNGVSEFGNSITKATVNNSVTGGAASINVLPANTNGWVEFIYDNASCETALGFSDVDLDAGFNSIDYGVSTTVGQFMIRNNGVMLSNSPLAANDILRIERIGSEMNFYRNGSFEYKITDVNTGPLIVDAAIAANGCRIYNARASFTMPATQSSPMTGLVAYYPCSGNFNDVSGNNKHGTVFGATPGTDKHGNAASAYLFDGVDDYVRIPNLGAYASFTLMSRIKTSSAELMNVFSGQNAGWYPSVQLGKVAWYDGIDWRRSTTVVNDNQWHDVAYIFENGVYRIYVDGQIQYSGVGVANISNGLVNRIGRIDPGSRYFNGLLDELRVYNRALNTVEINEIFNAGEVNDNLEYQALKDLYTSLSGSGWVNKTNWPATWPPTASNVQFRTWFGVTVTNGDVTALNLPANNLEGTIPASIVNLQKLQTINLSANQIFGALPAIELPQLTALNIEDNQLTAIGDLYLLTNKANLNITAQNNLLDFGDLEKNFTGAGTTPFQSFTFAPQGMLGAAQLVTWQVGEARSLGEPLQGDLNQYQWQKQDHEGVWQNIPGETNAILSKSYVVATDAGQYRIEVTNQKVTGLTLYSQPYVVKIDESWKTNTALIKGIPRALVISREGVEPTHSVGPYFLLSDLSEGESHNVFEAPPCLEGEYYVAFRMEYDLGDDRASSTWTSQLAITMYHGGISLWTQPLSVYQGEQTFISTIFHDGPISCDGNYSFKITRKGVTTDAPQDNISLTVLLYKNPSDVFNPESDVQLTCNYNTPERQTNLSWTTAAQGILEYDVEWVFIEEYEQFTESSNPEETKIAAFDFKEPVRITTKVPYYKHHVYYPDGKVWYRIRPIGFDPQHPGHRIVGKWSYSPCGKINITNHTPGKNWQEQTVFAEDGKYKKVMHYFDGTLRQRQSQTNLSTGEVTLVAESYYDLEGRKSLDVLAVPASDAMLTFKPAFNAFAVNADPAIAQNTSASRQKFHYDNGNADNSKLDPAKGAGLYYSPDNTRAMMHRDLLPDAEGYAYSQTEYLRDGTGRVSKQSGVGPEFKIDGDHSTKYFYANVAQEDLIRLFGSNAGNAAHYKKNLVLDANEQVSVSYLDQEDRVIATALAGRRPDNVEALESYTLLENAPDVTVNIISKNDKSKGASVTSHKILNVSPVIYTFNYDLAMLGSEISGMGCVACTFDLSITITDPEGRLVTLPVIAGNESADRLLYLRKNLTTADCTTPGSTAVQFELLLEEVGDYTITKTLTPRDLTFDEMKAVVSAAPEVQTAIQSIRDSYVRDHTADCAICTTCPDGNDAINEAIDDIAAQDCESILNNIINHFETVHAEDETPYEVTQSDIESHELYCQYTLCVQNIESDAFEKRLARIANWSDALTAGYNNLVNLDPFFNNPSLSGPPAKGAMQGKLGNILVATIEYDNNGDGIADGTREFRGNLDQITNPGHTPFLINDNGMLDPNGYHVLYRDLMKRRSALGESAYQAQLDRQRWALYKSFYLENKRATKRLMPEYQNCAPAMQQLEKPDESNALRTEEEIIAWGEANHLKAEPSDAELEMSLYSIKSKCNTALSEEHEQQIKDHLRDYFGGDRKNIFRLILKKNLPGQPSASQSLDAIKTILDSYNCGLDDVAVEDPLLCLNEVAVPSLIQSGSAMPINNNAAPSNIQSSSLQNVNTEQSSGEPDPALLGPCTPSLQNERAALMTLFNWTLGENWTSHNNWGSSVVDNTWTGITVNSSGYVTSINLENNNLNGSLGFVSFANFCSLSKIDLSDNKLVYALRTESINADRVRNLDLSNNNLSEDVLNAFEGDFLTDYFYDYNFSNNNFTYADLIPIANEFSLISGYNLNLTPQNSIDSEKNQVITAGESLVLTTNIDRSTNSKYQWFKIQDNGVHQALQAVPSETAHTYTITNANDSHNGIYYYKIYNNTANISLPSSLESHRIAVFVKNLCQPGLQNEYNALMALYNATGGGSWSRKDHWGEAFPANLGLWDGITTNGDGHVTAIELRDNGLTGHLSQSIIDQLENLCFLTTLNLSKNHLSGNLPVFVGFHSLNILDLSENNFSGTIPRFFAVNFEESWEAEINISSNDLSGYISPASLPTFTEIFLGGNRFTFSDILDVIYAHYDEEGERIYYDPQQIIDTERTVTVAPGGTLTLTTQIDRNTDPYSKYKWYKYVDGSNDQELTGDFAYNAHTFQIPNAGSVHEGQYYYKVINDGAYWLELRSHHITATVVEQPESFNICLEYDPNNITLQAFRYEINWQTEIEKCLANAAEEDAILTQLAIDKYIEEEISNFNSKYASKCLEGMVENLKYTYQPKEYHYTLYYYDQAGNLSQTVPPQGVFPLSPEQVESFIAGTKTEPAHQLITRYQYNSLNQLIWQSTPDAGVSAFGYNEKGQLRLSQNARQAGQRMSYTKYDEQGRIIEVGEMATAASISALSGMMQSEEFPLASEYALTDITRTHYDFPEASVQSTFPQQYLRTRVAWVEAQQTDRPDAVKTFYNYDIHGNVKSLMQRIPGLDDKRTDYVYDLVSGKVNYIMYQYGKQDQFIHRYTYDADNKVKVAWTSTDGYIWASDAVYFYYLHGPLARVELGEHRVQGLDYYYTLQGWLKGVNVPYADDHGGDGSISGVPRDVFAYSLGYYLNDYKAIEPTTVLPDTRDNLWGRYTETYANPGLYNGNISWMVTDLEPVGVAMNAREKGMQSMVYRYDQLHRIKESRSLTTYQPGTGFASRGAAEAYDEDYSYDANGNILTLQRRDEKKEMKDDWQYTYYAGTNRLKKVKPDAVVTYEYDAIGNLVRDHEDGTTISWTPYGKVHEVLKDDGSVVKFRYDASGNRVEKKIVKTDTTITTRYVRDAGGNVMAVYKEADAVEHSIYGSSRLGLYKGGQRVGHRTLGRKNYELSNHLGNVLAVVTDNINMTPTEVTAKVVSVNDYYPFGLDMPGRSDIKTDGDEAPPEPSTPELVSFHPLNGNAEDEGGNNIDGVVNGATLTSDNQGQPNNAYNFDGNDYITLPNTKALHSFVQNTGVFTIAAFIKLSTVNDRSTIVSSLNTRQGKGFAFMYEYHSETYGLNQLRFSSTNGSVGQYNLAKGAKFSVNDTNWHHVAVVGDGQNIRFYVDGVDDGNPTPLTAFSSGDASENTMIGATPTLGGITPTTNMHGAIDEVHIFSEALTQAEISKLAQRLPLGQASGPVASADYPFNGNAADQSRNDHHGTVTGATLTSDNQNQPNKAYAFDGNDHITLQNTKESMAFVQNTHVFSIAAFVKIDDLTKRSTIVASTQTTAEKGFFFMYENATKQLRFVSTQGVSGQNNQAGGTQNTINDNNWHHVAVIGDGQTVRFYVDGVADGSPAPVIHSSSGNSTWNTVIGAGPYSSVSVSPATTMHGAIDEVQIFNKALTQAEIGKLAQRLPLVDEIGDPIASTEGAYRYGFNGKEKDSSGEFGNTHYDYGFRIYDPSIAKFLSVDPLFRIYSMLTPYQFASNTPLQAIDVDGLEGVRYDVYYKENGKAKIKTIVEMDVYVGVGINGYGIHDLPTIANNLNKEYNRFDTNTGEIHPFKVDGKAVEFHFNIKAYDSEINTPDAFASKLRKTSTVDTSSPVMLENGSPLEDQTTGEIIMKKSITGVVLAQGQINGEGATILNRSIINPSSINIRHTEAHEIAHFILLGAENPDTPEQHAKFGGIFTYRTVDSKGNEISGVFPMSNSNIKTFIKNIPVKKEEPVIDPDHYKINN